jgi:hypothetical protein
MASPIIICFIISQIDWGNDMEAPIAVMQAREKDAPANKREF